jgi:hypothetical protein
MSVRRDRSGSDWDPSDSDRRRRQRRVTVHEQPSVLEDAERLLRDLRLSVRKSSRAQA